MSNELITVEDYNTALINFTDPFEYVVDTANMELNENYISDFVSIIKTSSTYDNIPCIQYKFEFETELWGKQFYLMNEQGNISFSLSVNYQNIDGVHTLTILSYMDNLKLVLVMNDAVLENAQELRMKVSLKNNRFFEDFNKRTYEFIVENWEGLLIRYYELRLKTIDNEIILLDPIRVEGSSVQTVTFEYTPQKVLQEVVELIVHKGE